MSKRVLEVVVKVKDEASKGLDKFAGKLGISKTALAGMAAGAAIAVAALKKMADALIKTIQEVSALGDSFDKMSKRTGESVDTLAQWVYSAELAGGSSRDIEIAFKKLAKSMYDADQGLSTAVRAFDNLGVAVTDSNGELRDTNEVMLDLAEAFQHSTNRTETMAVAQDVLGRGALQLVAILEQGKKALSDQADEYERLRGPMSEVSTKSAELIDANLRLKTSMDGAKAEMVQGLLPAITDIENALASMIGEVVNAKSAFDDFMGGLRDKLHGIDDSVVVMTDLEFHFMMLTQQANAANVALKDFSMAEFVDTEDVDNIILVNEQMALFNEMVAETILKEKERAEALGEIAAKKAEIVDVTDDQITAEEQLMDVVDSTAANFERLASNSLSAMLKGTDGAIMFGRALRTVVMDAISAVIAKMLVLKAVSAFLGMFTGGGSTSAAFSAFGAASPGEPNFIGPVSTGASTASAMSGASMVAPSSIPSPGGRDVSVSMNIARPIGILDVLDLARSSVYSARKLAEANL